MSRSKSAPTKDAERGEDQWKKSRTERKRQDRVRTRRKTDKSLPDNALPGDVVSTLGPSWLVKTTAGYVVCGISGTVDSPHEQTILTVGDRVWITVLEEQSEHGYPTGSVVKVDERDTVLSRQAAGRVKREQVMVSNVQQLAIVMSAVHPTYNKRLIDRYLIAADKGDLTPMIFLNKMDLVPDEDRFELKEDLSAYWDDLGMPVVYASAETDEGLDKIRELISGTSTLLAGPSGVGKSSIINRLTDAKQRVGEISEMYDKGKHTTTGSTWFPLEEGGSIVDSPGIREFGIWELDKEELPYYFGEFVALMHDCKFSPCSHTHEPDCAVKDALEEGRIDPDRYLSYLTLLEDLDTPDTRR